MRSFLKLPFSSQNKKRERVWNKRYGIRPLREHFTVQMLRCCGISLNKWNFRSLQEMSVPV